MAKSAREIFDHLKSTRVAQASKSLAEFVGSGSPIVIDELYESRMSTCHGCKFIKNKDTNPSCLLCGCYLKIKARFATEACPIDKWDKVDPKSSQVKGHEHDESVPGGCC